MVGARVTVITVLHPEMTRRTRVTNQNQSIGVTLRARTDTSSCANIIVEISRVSPVQLPVFPNTYGRPINNNGHMLTGASPFIYRTRARARANRPRGRRFPKCRVTVPGAFRFYFGVTRNRKFGRRAHKRETRGRTTSPAVILIPSVKFT